jgi:hypothetical protein
MIRNARSCPDVGSLFDSDGIDMDKQTNDQVHLSVQKVIVDVPKEEIDQYVKQTIGVQDVIELITGVVIRNSVD